MVCRRVHCTNCSNRERIQLPGEDKPTKRRLCHTCSISIENRTHEYIKTMSQSEGQEER